MKTIWEVLEWGEPQPGVWYPREVVYRMYDANDSQDGLQIHWKLTQLELNEPFKDEDWMEFSFPENAVVTEYFQNESLGKIFIWGKDNAPLKEFGAEGE